jgi:hypothetical protein
VAHLGGLSFSALLLTLIVAMGIVWYSQQYGGDASGGAAALASAVADAAGALPSGWGGLAGGGQAAARARKLRSTEYVD